MFNSTYPRSLRCWINDLLERSGRLSFLIPSQQFLGGIQSELLKNKSLIDDTHLKYFASSFSHPPFFQFQLLLSIHIPIFSLHNITYISFVLMVSLKPILYNEVLPHLVFSCGFLALCALVFNLQPHYMTLNDFVITIFGLIALPSTNLSSGSYLICFTRFFLFNFFWCSYALWFQPLLLQHARREPIFCEMLDLSISFCGRFWYMQFFSRIPLYLLT